MTGTARRLGAVALVLALGMVVLGRAGEVPSPLVNQGGALGHRLAVLHPIEQPALSDDWRALTRRVVPRGGHAMVVLGLADDLRCADIAARGGEVTLSVLLPRRLETPSSEGTPTGIWHDILVPRNRVTCALSPLVLAEWRPHASGPVVFAAGGAEVTVEVAFAGRFGVATRPFFVGLANAYLIKGHCPLYCRREAELGRKYLDMLRRHHVTPIQSWVSVPPVRDGALDLDHQAAQGLSFRQMAMADDQPWVNFPRLSLYPDPVAYLEALQRTLRAEGLEGRAWVYVRDEPTDFTALAAELALYRRHAPEIKTMVTTPTRPPLAPLIDIFAPHLAQLAPHGAGALEAYAGKQLWPYVSCMGSCGPNRAGNPLARRQPGPDPGLADFLIDRPASRIMEYFATLARIGAHGGLYYHAVEGYPLYRQGVDVLDDPWNFGGNGDGLLIYPGRPGSFGLTSHQPLASFRLKLIRQAIERYWR